MALLFIPLAVLAQILGLTTVALISVWMIKYLDGFAWDGSSQQFNLHPFLMVIGLIYFYGNAIIIYRITSGLNVPRLAVKLAHFILQLCAFICSIIALVAVFQFHNANQIPNMYSMHSWAGIATVVMFGLQLLFGFLIFLFPKLPERYRTLYMSSHIFFGVFILGLAGATVLMGIGEKLAFAGNYSEFPKAAIVGNVAGSACIGFICIIIFIVTNPNFKFHSYEHVDKL
ncbi:cytochrome b reductase 1-like isoform X2 [Anneissia japonica]|uniref:cytochrome b reductase 1-like isoform X2 n=1 Tax=Anneissia japonica TaxID=1529436 RepID=UPI0014257880|nr:cytochrome b reductase 1-like isoform X2 [Anneissia japonica]XP_033127310.1 cytochrome b reductase 1-like isoform X2 [Anneissia japonica]